MQLAELDYSLPAECIAQEPVTPRDSARLMVVERATGRVRHRVFRDLPDELAGTGPAGWRIFRNRVRVLRARLEGRRPTGGAVECFLLTPLEPAEARRDAPLEECWKCLLRPGRKLIRGAEFQFADGSRAEVIGRCAGGTFAVRFTGSAERGGVLALSERLGRIPLPPYIERTPDDPRNQSDAEHYQTVYADPEESRAVAAPTAGLHFTPELIATLEEAGHTFHDLSLHVGTGTFQPIQCERVEEHAIHREFYRIGPETLRAQNGTDGRRLAIGTTTLRALEDWAARSESAAGPESRTPPADGFSAEAGIFIYPPHTFATVDALVTNFHLPRSTLLCLVGAFLEPGGTGGIKRLMELYREAIAHGYRFYSYGDAMLVL